MLVGEAIVLDYVEYHRPKARAELEWFRQQPTLRSAIEYAALAIDQEGKRYSHQRRRTTECLWQAREALLANVAAIKQCASFDDLYALIERLVQPIWGSGPLYVYDTSLRCGAKLNLLPKRVYLHAGTRDGFEALGFHGRAQTVEVSRLPAFLRELEPHEIEDALCLYKEELRHADEELTEALAPHLWCGSMERRKTGC